MDKVNKFVENIRKYFRGVATEVKRISWPSSDELKASTIIVLITLVSVTVYLWLCSSIFGRVIDKLRSL